MELAKVLESRRAFYAGAQALFGRMMRATGDSPADAEPTEEEMDFMRRIDAELRAFVADVKAGKA
jgi:hypothetical protein